MEFFRKKISWIIGVGFLSLLGSFFIDNFSFKLLSLVGFTTAVVFLIFETKKISIYKKEFEVKTEGFSALTENLKDGVVIYDPDFTIISLNKEVENMFNIKRNDFVGKKIQPKTSLLKDDKLFVQILFPSLASSAVQTSESDEWPRVVEITTENPTRKFLTYLSSVSKEEGGVSYFIKIIRDETKEKTAKDNKSEFINVAAHQLRTPLTSINWALENIVKGSNELPEAIASTAADALKISEKSLKTVNDLLSVAKMDDGELSFSFSRVELAPFLREIVKATEQFANERSVSIFFNPIPPEWEGAAAKIDEEQLGVACTNLIDNAIKYNSKNGEVSVSLEVFPENKTAKISVKDTGIGVPKNDLNKIFGKFFRSKNAEELESGGSGLGLYIVKNIIELHGGRVGFDSQEDRGSTFWFSLPLIN